LNRLRIQRDKHFTNRAQKSDKKGVLKKSQIIDIQPIYLNASRSAVKPDGNIALFHNNRNLSYAIGIFQHGLHLLSISLNINVFNFLTLFGKSFTSLICIGSGILPKNQYFIRHGATSSKELMHKKDNRYFLKFQAIVE
jgi:hypothetical protein